MDRLTVLFPFVGILVGLGLADLVFSVHRSVRAGRQWHALPAAWVVITFLFVVLYWWIFTEIGGYDTFRSLWRFAFHLVTPLLLVLVCAAALPDGDADEPDLLAYYVRNRRYVFGLWTLLFVHIALDYGFNYGSWERAPPWVMLASALATASLAVTANKAYHAAVTAGLLAALALLITGYSLQV
ncbi:hypothetical protein RQM47_07790 [Rubrivirga sp. S365]|uniref:hypothetical protein n=1 Tax=Rubrivirga sp. S365 TaxID=3076080 RepID=UPI0028C78880|nr:hypothetical protein [Rubrivirga sp. S365]MDT7856537.1 hypothetical protein [Rubrivirga sp. S365]